MTSLNGRIDALVSSGVLPQLRVSGSHPIGDTELLAKQRQANAVLEAAIKKERVHSARVTEELAALKTQYAQVKREASVLARECAQLRSEVADRDDKMFALAERARLDREECISNLRHELKAEADQAARKRPRDDDGKGKEEEENESAATGAGGNDDDDNKKDDSIGWEFSDE